MLSYVVSIYWIFSSKNSAVNHRKWQQIDSHWVKVSVLPLKMRVGLCFNHSRTISTKFFQWNCNNGSFFFLLPLSLVMLSWVRIAIDAMIEPLPLQPNTLYARLDICFALTTNVCNLVFPLVFSVFHVFLWAPFWFIDNRSLRLPIRHFQWHFAKSKIKNTFIHRQNKKIHESIRFAS